jgi:hypothetical protein
MSDGLPQQFELDLTEVRSPTHSTEPIETKLSMRESGMRVYRTVQRPRISIRPWKLARFDRLRQLPESLYRRIAGDS